MFASSELERSMTAARPRFNRSTRAERLQTRTLITDTLFGERRAGCWNSQLPVSLISSSGIWLSALVPYDAAPMYTISMQAVRSMEVGCRPGCQAIKSIHPRVLAVAATAWAPMRATPMTVSHIGTAELSHVEVEVELVLMWPQPDLVVFPPLLVVNPGLN